MMRSSVVELLYHFHYLVPLGVVAVLAYDMTALILWSAAERSLSTLKYPIVTVLEPPIVDVVQQLGWGSVIDDVPTAILVPALLFQLGVISMVVYVIFCSLRHMIQVERFDIWQILRRSWNRRENRRSRAFRNTYFFMTAGVNILLLMAFLALIHYMHEMSVVIAGLMVLLVVTLIVAPYVLVAVPSAVIERQGIVGSLRRGVQLAAGNRLRLTWFTGLSSAVVFLLPFVVVHFATRASGWTVSLPLSNTAEIIVGYVVAWMLSGIQLSLGCVFGMTAYLELRRIEDRVGTQNRRVT